MVSATFLIALAMAITTPKCLDIQLPGGGKINNCAEGVSLTLDSIPTIPDPVSEGEPTPVPTPAPTPEEAEGDFEDFMPAPPDSLDVPPESGGGEEFGGGLESGVEEELDEEPVDIPTLDLIGKWNMTGRSNGYPVSSEIASSGTGPISFPERYRICQTEIFLHSIM